MMAKYLYRTCPKCNDYLGVVVPEPPEPVTEVAIEKGVITQDEFMEKIKAERATYQAMFQKVIH